MDWAKKAEAAMGHLEKGGRVYPAAASLAVIDDIVAGLGPASIAQKRGYKLDLIETAIGHVTTAVHGPGPVPKLVEGGWYERKGDSYIVSLEFAAAWSATREAT